MMPETLGWVGGNSSLFLVLGMCSYIRLGADIEQESFVLRDDFPVASGRWSRMIKRYQKLRESEATDWPRSFWNGMQFFDR